MSAELRSGEVRVVAGCLFEVVLPSVAAPSPWRWEEERRRTGEVTLLGDDRQGSEHRFRFRAEAAGAAAGRVELRFEAGPGLERSLEVHVAAEPWPHS